MPGSSRTSARDERAAQDLAPAALVRRPDEARRSSRARATTRRTAATRSSPSSSRKCAPSTIGQPPQRRELHLLVLGQLAARPPHPERVERRAEPLGRAPGAAQDPLRRGSGVTSASTRSATACALSGSSTAACRRAPTSSATSRSASSRSADRRSVRKKLSSATLGALGRIDLPGAQPLLQRLRRQVDEHDLVRLLEHLVGERLAYPDLGELGDRVVQALEVLDVDGGDHVDSCRKHLVDVLPALLVARVRQVRVRELVDQRQLGRAADDRVDVHLLQLEAAVGRAQARHLLEPLRERGGLRTVVRLEVADHDVPPVRMCRAPLLQHPVGLPDTRRHPQQDPIAATHRADPMPRRRCTRSGRSA